MCERIRGESIGRKDGGGVEKHICGQKAFAPSCSGGAVLTEGQQHPGKIPHKHTGKTHGPKIDTHIHSVYISCPSFSTYTHPGGERERKRSIWIAWCDSQTGLHTPSAPSTLIQPPHTIQHTHARKHTHARTHSLTQTNFSQPSLSPLFILCP